MRTRIWIALHALLLVLPAVAALLRWPDCALNGVEPAPEAPRWTLGAWVDEGIQRSVTHAFESHLGLRGVLVRTDNTLLHASLGESKPESIVKVGKHGTLYVEDDIAYAAKRPQDLPPASTIEHVADLTGRLQRRLQRDHARLVVVISPSKTAVWPDDVPRGWSRPGGTPRSDTFVHDELASALRSHGVTFADGHEILARAQDREAVFPRAARHWSAVGACRVLAEIAPDLVPGGCAYGWRTDVDPYDRGQPDFDLFRLLDTWHPFFVAPPVAVLTRAPPPEERPRTLFVGTSFTWLLVDAARANVRDAECFYYNSTIYDARGAVPLPIGTVDPASPTWAAHALGKDVYVLELFEGYVHGDYARGFLETMLAKL